MKKSPLSWFRCNSCWIFEITWFRSRPPKNTSRRDGAIAGAIKGMAGADVGRDAF